MREILFMNRKKLKDIGFGNSDIVAFINARARAGTADSEETIKLILAELSNSGREKMKEFIAATPILPDPGSDKPRLNTISIEVSPIPPMLSEKEFHLEISFHRQVDPELFETKEPFTLRGPNRYVFQDVSFSHLIHLRINADDGNVLSERILIPGAPQSATHSSFSTMDWQVSPPPRKRRETGSGRSKSFRPFGGGHPPKSGTARCDTCSQYPV